MVQYFDECFSATKWRRYLLRRDICPRSSVHVTHKLRRLWWSWRSLHVNVEFSHWRWWVRASLYLTVDTIQRSFGLLLRFIFKNPMETWHTKDSQTNSQTGFVSVSRCVWVTAGHSPGDCLPRVHFCVAGKMIHGRVSQMFRAAGIWLCNNHVCPRTRR